MKAVFFAAVFVFCGQNAAFSNPEPTQKVQGNRKSEKVDSSKNGRVVRPAFHLDESAAKADSTERYSSRVIYTAPSKDTGVQRPTFLSNPRVLPPNPLLDANQHNPYANRQGRR